MGLNARNVRDLSNWMIGTIALGIQTRWGEDSLGEFAKTIGLNKSTVAQYRWVVSKFGVDYNVTYGLPWSYYRIAAGTDAPQETLEHFQDQSMTIAEAQHHVKGLSQLVSNENKSSFKINIVCNIENADVIQRLINRLEEDERLQIRYNRFDS